jgi:GT2 family glycosyltransferase
MADQDSASRIFIGVPSRDMTASAICGRLALLLVDLARRSDAPAIEIVAGYPVDRVRNRICKRFLESDADYVLMIDDDTVPPATVLDMARHDKDVVGALCYAYLPALGYYSVAYPSGNGDRRAPRLGIGDQIEHRGLMEVELVGTACLLIHRRVLEALDPPYFKMVLDDDCLYIKDSEDFTFCRKARAAGFSVWLDTDQPCSHVKALDMHASVRWAQEYAARRRLAELDL